VTNREIGKDKVASGDRSVKVDHARDRGTSQNACAVGVLLSTTGSHGPGMFEGGEEKVARVHMEGDVA